MIRVLNRKGWKMKRITLIAMCVALMLCLALAGCATEAQQISAEIDKLGEITLESGESIDELNQRYEALGDEEKANVENYSVLQEANIAYDELLLEKECTDAIALGLQSGWDALTQDWNSFADRGAALASCANAELEAVSGYEPSSFKNQAYASLISKYKSALQDELAGLAAYPSDPSTYNSKFVDSGQPSRAECLKALVDDYGLSVEEKYAEVLSSELNPSYGHLIGYNDPVLISTDKGDVKVAVERFAYGADDLSSLKSAGVIADNQSIVYLLCTVSNVSYPVGEDYDEYMRFEELASVEDASGISLSAMDSSMEYPGYEGIGAGVFGVYPGSDVQVGESKRCSIPFIVDEGTEELCVNFTTGDMLIASL